MSETPIIDSLIAHLEDDEYPDVGVMRSRKDRANRARAELAALRERVAKLEAVRVWHKRTGCFARLDPRQHFTNEGDCYEPKSATMEAGESLVMRLPGEHPSDMECDLCSILDCPANCEDHYHHDGCPSCDVAREATK